MLSRTVLVKNITNLSEARYCAGMGVEYLSFDLNHDSPHFLPKPAFDEIRNWLTGIKVLGHTHLTDVSELTALKDDYQLDGYVLSSEESVTSGLTGIFLELSVNDPFLEDKLNIYSSSVEYFILIADEIDDEVLNKVNKLAALFPVMVGYSVDAEQLSEITDAGFAFEGSKEERPGFNQYDQLMDKLESLETD